MKSDPSIIQALNTVNEESQQLGLNINSGMAKIMKINQSNDT